MKQKLVKRTLELLWFSQVFATANNPASLVRSMFLLNESSRQVSSAAITNEKRTCAFVNSVTHSSIIICSSACFFAVKSNGASTLYNKGKFLFSAAEQKRGEGGGEKNNNPYL